MPPCPPPLSPAHLTARLDELAQLAPGWLNGEGPALPAEGLAWANGLLLRAHAAGVPVPYLYPTVEGELSAEWPLGRWTLSATIGLTARGAYLHATDLQSDAAEERECSLAGPEGEAVLVAFVAGFAPLPAPAAAPTQPRPPPADRGPWPSSSSGPAGAASSSCTPTAPSASPS